MVGTHRWQVRPLGEMMKTIDIGDRQVEFPEPSDSPGVAIATDGGTIGVHWTDSSGKFHSLRLDRCVGTETRDHLFAKGSPEQADAEDLGHHPSLVEEMVSILHWAVEAARD